MSDQTQTILSKDAFDKFAADVERPGKVIPKLADLAEKRKGVIYEPAYAMCKTLNGSCSCKVRGDAPCDAILGLLEDEVDAKEELARMERESADDEEWGI